jgi:hypothetical protein
MDHTGASFARGAGELRRKLGAEDDQRLGLFDAVAQGALASILCRRWPRSAETIGDFFLQAEEISMGAMHPLPSDGIGAPSNVFKRPQARNARTS